MNWSCNIEFENIPTHQCHVDFQECKSDYHFKNALFWFVLLLWLKLNIILSYVGFVTEEVLKMAWIKDDFDDCENQTYLFMSLLIESIHIHGEI